MAHTATGPTIFKHMPFLGRAGGSARRSSAALGLLVAMCALIIAGGPVASARAALNWNATPLAVDPGKSLTAVSCPSASLCVASAGAQAMAFNPSRFRRPQPHTLFTGRGLQLDGLWCSVSTLCVATDFQSAVSFNPGRFTSKLQTTRLETVTGEGLVSVRCPARSECVAVDSYGGGMTYDPLTHRVLRRRISIDGNERLTALACPSISQCTALDDAGYEYTFQPRTGQRVGSFQIDQAAGLDAPSGDSTNELDAISCPTTKLCAAVDTLGNIITFDPQLNGAAEAFGSTTISYPGSSLSAISCKPSGVCVAVDRSGNAIAGSADSQSWQLQPVDPGHAFNAVACPTKTECVAVDNDGNAYRLYPNLQ